VGVVGGAALALPGATVLRARVSGVGEADPVVFALAAIVLLAAALVAAWLPARRAVRLDPAVVLRGE
jgi:putative ABC transport system permease protein